MTTLSGVLSRRFLVGGAGALMGVARSGRRLAARRQSEGRADAAAGRRPEKSGCARREMSVGGAFGKKPISCQRDAAAGLVVVSVCADTDTSVEAVLPLQADGPMLGGHRLVGSVATRCARIYKLKGLV